MGFKKWGVSSDCLSVHYTKTVHSSKLKEAKKIIKSFILFCLAYFHNFKNFLIN